MSDLSNLNLRLQYQGGANQQARMNQDKLKSLKKALLYSYQAATIQLSDGREFRCLINPDRLSMDLDNKIISIPFEDVCLNGGTGGNSGEMSQQDNQFNEGTWKDLRNLYATLRLAEDNWEDMVNPDQIDTIAEPPEINGEKIPEGVQPTNLHEGDTFYWKEGSSHWIVYLQRLNETAYFRADIRRCRYLLTLGNGSEYWVYVRGPVEQNIMWTQANSVYFNKPNYTLIMYITKNSETVEYFKRFSKIMIDGRPWEVQATDSVSTPGIIEMTLKETYNNTVETDIEQAVQKAEQVQEIEKPDTELPYIYGQSVVYPYDSHTYKLKNYDPTIGGGVWSLEGQSTPNVVKIINSTLTDAELSITTGKSGKFALVYKADGKVVAALDITIDTL